MLEKNKLIVVFLVVLSTFSAAILGSCVKYISNDLNPFMICFYRTFFGLLLILPFVIKNNFQVLKSKNIKLQFIRSMVNVISMICWFSALGIIPLEKATALGFTTPLFTTILAVIFLNEINSAIAMHNASTQFADGSEFGFGGEIGISTNKLPPRGPVGINQLTSYKYIVEGKGSIRPR